MKDVKDFILFIIYMVSGGVFVLTVNHILALLENQQALWFMNILGFSYG